MAFSLSSREEIAGLDLRDCCVVAVQVATHRGALRLVRAGHVPLALKADEATVVAAIRRLWREAGLTTYTVACTLRSDRLTVKPFRLSGLTRAEIDAALRLNAEESLQVPPDRLVTGCHFSRTSESADGKMTVEGVLVASFAAAVDAQLALLRSAGLYPVCMDASGLALGNLFLTLNPSRPKGDVVCLVNLSAHTADIVIIGEDDSIYPLTVLSRASTWNEAADYLATNIQDALKYHQFKLRRAPVQRLLITGYLPAREPLFKSVLQRLALPVEFWNPVARLAASRSSVRALQANEAVAPLLATAAGLALRGD